MNLMNDNAIWNGYQGGDRIRMKSNHGITGLINKVVWNWAIILWNDESMGYARIQEIEPVTGIKGKYFAEVEGNK